MVDFRRPAEDRNGAPPPLEDPDRWTIPKTLAPPLPSDEVLLLRQLLAAQKEQLMWSQRTAVIVREIRTVPFWSLVWLFVKAAFAAIPAAIIVAVIVALVNAVIAGVLAALVGALLLGASSGQNPPPVPTSPAPPAQPAAQVASAIRLVVPTWSIRV